MLLLLYVWFPSLSLHHCFSLPRLSQSLRRSVSALTVDMERGASLLRSSLDASVAHLHHIRSRLNGHTADAELRAHLSTLLNDIALSVGVGSRGDQGRRGGIPSSGDRRSSSLVLKDEAEGEERRLGFAENMTETAEAVKKGYNVLLDAYEKSQEKVVLLATEIRQLKEDLASARPRIQALDEANASAKSRAESLLRAEARVSELRAELAASKSQQKVLEEEVGE